MAYGVLCAVAFVGAYVVNMLYTSVFYHRGLTHRAIRLRRLTRRIVILTGNWVTGIDPKAWACMHRLHHKYSDTEKDPHSPTYKGVLPILKVQLDSYGKAMRGLMRGQRYYTSIVRDLDFPVNWLNRRGLWFLPHALHTLAAVAMGGIFGAWILAGAYWLGMMSHPIQGWMVNALAHRYGYRNYSTRDQSTNNLLVAWLVMGEGLQNNHHFRPRSARFSVKWWESDPGYLLCRLASLMGLIELR